MSKLIFDIETVGTDFESLDEASQEYFLKYAKDEEEELTIKESTSFYPLTAQIVAIGMLELEKNEGVIFFQSPNQEIKNFTEKSASRSNTAPSGIIPDKENNIDYIVGTEKQILENFWQRIQKYSQFITFNGRTFDCPFIILRSGILKVKPTRELMPYRYDAKIHIDLLDQLTFYGALRRRFNLHMWCQVFGIKSPKDEGMTGYDVKEYFKQGKYLDIARYCFRDIQATKELYLCWEKYIRL